MSKKRKRSCLIHGDKYSIEDTFKIIVPYLDPDGENKSKRKIDFYGDMIKPNSQRYQTFYYKGCTCVKCGLKASYFEKNKQSNENVYHLNLYGIDESGCPVLFTKDHILPVSKGGKDDITNFQTMCVKCNTSKSNNMSLRDKLHTFVSKPEAIKRLMVDYYKKYPVHKRKEVIE